MKFKRFNDVYMVRIDLGEEIMEALGSLCRIENIRLAQVNAIGATDQAVIGVYDLKDQAYREEKLTGFMEITSLTGNITFVNDKPYIHLHATVADQQHTIHGGHVINMRVGATCEMFVRVLDGSVGRVRNEELGINLWELE